MVEHPKAGLQEGGGEGPAVISPIMVDDDPGASDDDYDFLRDPHEGEEDLLFDDPNEGEGEGDKDDEEEDDEI